MSTNRRAAVFLACQTLLLIGCEGPRPREQSVKPGINRTYLAADLDVDEMTQRFELESREIYARRFEIAAQLGLRPGMAVADIGAGTGLFVDLFAKGVGRTGVVYAVDIAPRFIEHLRRRAQAKGLSQVEVVLCTERTVELPRNSIDIAFICDVYHHFEYPRSTIAWLHHALRDRGEIVLIDFERIPGVSRDWILGHVRAGKAEVTAELESFGFALVEEVDVPGLEENYFLRFRKR